MKLFSFWLAKKILNFRTVTCYVSNLGDTLKRPHNRSASQHVQVTTNSVQVTCSCAYYLPTPKRPPWSRDNVPTSWPEWRRIFKDGKIQGTSPPWGTLSRLTRVVDLLHVKEPQAPRGPLSKITGHLPSKYIVSNSSGRWFRRSLVGGASGDFALRGYGGWFEIQRGRTIDHIEVAVHGESRPLNTIPSPYSSFSDTAFNMTKMHFSWQ
jgi:hypothetical protein